MTGKRMAVRKREMSSSGGEERKGSGEGCHGKVGGREKQKPGEILGKGVRQMGWRDWREA